MARGRARAVQKQNVRGMANGKGKGKGVGARAVQKQNVRGMANGKGKGKGVGNRNSSPGQWMFVPSNHGQRQFQRPRVQMNSGNGFNRKGAGKGFRPTVAPRQVRNFMRTQKVLQRAPVTARFNKVMNKSSAKGGSPNLDKKRLDQLRVTNELDKIRDIDADRKVWVAGLGQSPSWKKVQEHFKSIGKAKVALMTNGKACIAFNSAAEASDAIATYNGSEFAGKPIEVDVWTQKEKKERKARVPGSKKNKKNVKTGFAAKVATKMQGNKGLATSKFWEKLKAMDADLKVKVTNVAEAVTGGVLMKHFKELGAECTVAALFDNKKGSACVGFKTAEDTESAISIVGGSDLSGQSLEVTTWKRPEKKNKKTSD